MRYRTVFFTTREYKLQVKIRGTPLPMRGELESRLGKVEMSEKRKMASLIQLSGIIRNVHPKTGSEDEKEGDQDEEMKQNNDSKQDENKDSTKAKQDGHEETRKGDRVGNREWTPMHANRLLLTVSFPAA